MRFLITIQILLYSSFLFGQTELQLKITNIQEAKGQILIGIFNNEENFPEGEEFKTVTIQIESLDLEVQHINLPKGEYAIALLHDKNSDGQCNYNWIGVPTEAYGFSQNVKPLLTVPSFEETKFLMEDFQSMTISLIQ